MNDNLNIKQIAELAGVSTATVSRVLNEKEKVSTKTREKVEKIIEQTGYMPNMLGRHLIEGKTFLVGLISLTVSGDAIPKLLEGVSHVLENQHYSIVAGSTYGQLEKELSLLEAFHKKQVDGILLHTNEVLPIHLEMIQKMKIPVISLFQDASKSNLPSVILDDFSFVYDATQYLIDLGHQHIAYIGGPENNVSNGQLRRKGYVEAMKNSHLLVEESHCKEGNWHIGSGYEAMENILKSRPVTALVAANEGMAIGAINCIYDAGLKVPEDISVIGADDTSLARAARPELTAIHLPYYEMGIKAAQLLLECMNQEKVSVNKVIMNYELKERKSTKGIG